MNPVTLGDIDLSLPATLGAAHRRGGQWVLLRLGHLPVGRVRLTMIPAGGADDRGLAEVLSRPDLSRSVAGALARHLVEQIGHGGDVGIGAAIRASQLAPRTDELPAVTAAICTQGRRLELGRALTALRSCVTEGVAAMVVCNTPGIDELAAVREEHPWVTLAHEPVPGLSRARNLALREARTPIVAFIDDDTVVDAGWARAIRIAFRDTPETTAICGLVEPLELDTPGSIAVEAYGGMARGYRRRWSFAGGNAGQPLLRTHGITSQLGVGANLAVRRELAVGLGGFDVALGAGTTSGGGEDLEFLFRTIKAGYVAGYEPAALLRHAHRTTLDEAASQAELWGSGMRAYLERTASAYPEERWSARFLLAWLLVSWYGRRAVSSAVWPAPQRRLLWSDLRGIRQGADRYRESSRAAPSPAVPRSGTTSRQHRQLRDVLDLRLPVATLPAPDASEVALIVMLDGRTLGEVRLVPVQGVVGAARIRDAVAMAFRTHLLGIPDHQAGLALLHACRQSAPNADRPE